MKYLTLIRTIALLHQYQRPVKKIQHDGREVEYIEATVADVALGQQAGARGPRPVARRPAAADAEPADAPGPDGL